MFGNETILITGGAGFIGYHICDQYLKNGAKKIIIYDNMSSGHLSNIHELGEKYPDQEVYLVIGDILDKQTLIDTMVTHNITMCNHHAAQLEITKCIEKPKYDIDTNLTGTLNVLDAMVAAGVDRLINASSACVYGQNDTGNPSVQGYDYPNPHWVYGMSKHAAEQLITIYCHDYGLKAVSFRYSIVMGVKEWYGRVGTMFIRRALEGYELIIFGDGKQVRDIIDVEDAALANKNAFAFLNSMDEGKHEIFNISSQVPYTVRDIAESVLTAVYGEVDEDKIIYEDVNQGEYSQFIKDRIRIPNELRTMWLDNRKMVRDLNVIPSTTLKDIFKKEAYWITTEPSYWDNYHI